MALLIQRKVFLSNSLHISRMQDRNNNKNEGLLSPGATKLANKKDQMKDRKKT